MKQILHVTCSPKGHCAESSRLSQSIVDRLLARDPNSLVLYRNLGDGSIPHIDEDYALSQQSSADVSQEGSAATSAMLVKELEDADIVVIGTPVHNFTVPSVLKA